MRVRSALGIALLLLTGCKLNTDYFKDYRGVNLMSSYGFAATKPVADGGGPQWALEPYAAYAAVTIPTAYDPTDYMTWEDVGIELAGVNDSDTPPKPVNVGPDGSSPAYRLEIKNLFVDGDLEGLATVTAVSGALSDSWWVASTNAAVTVGTASFTSVVSPFGSFDPISNQSLFFSGISGNTLQVTFDSISVPLWERSGGYRLRFDFRYTATIATMHIAYPSGGGVTDFESNGGTGNWNIPGLDNQSDSIVGFSRFFTHDGSASSVVVTLGSGSNFDEAVIDNVRLVQTDIPPYVKATFPRLDSGALKLLPGQRTGDYKLTFWVHDDPTADQTGGSGITHSSNRLRPSGITVQVTGTEKQGTKSYKIFEARPSSGWPTWTQLTFSMGFDFVNSNADLAGSPALVFEIAPTDTQGSRDAGSVLIAQPTLTFNP